MPFTNYKQVLLTLVGNLKRLRHFSTKLHIERLSKLIDHLITRIETDSFSIAVVGEFKRGKSTFINAILGEEILPADVLPTTATLNRVTYGSKPLVKIIFKDGEQREIAINKLVSFVTKLTPECEAVAATVKEAVIYFPVNYCRKNVEIIDTPGLSDDEKMTAVTLSVLQSVEAAIMVTSALAPFAESEGNFITQKLLANNLGCIIFVVTGIDHFKRPEDADKVVITVEKRIKDFVENWAEQQFVKNSQEYKVYLQKITKLKIFGLSAYQALEAKLNSNDTLLAQSRFQEFEAVLQKLLQQERGKITLQVIANQAIASAREIIKIIETRQNELEIQQEYFRNRYNKINNVIVSFQQIKKQNIFQVNATSNTIKSKVQSLIKSIKNQLKQSAERVIESTYVNSLMETKVLQQQFAIHVSDAVQSTSYKIAEKIQDVIRQDLSEAVQQMQTLVEIAPEVMHTVEMHLTQIDENIVIQNNSVLVNKLLNQAFNEFNQEQPSHLLTLFPCSPEVFIVGDESSDLYTVVGGIAGSLFRSLRSSGISNAQKAINFKNNYKHKIIVEIEKELQSHNTKQVVDDYIYQKCKNLETLKNQVDQEISSWIEQTRNTLAKLLGKQQALAENERKALDAMHTETQNILNNAWVVSEQLCQIMQVDREDNLETKICTNCRYGNDSKSRFCIKCGTCLG